jgi:hypothetical protein
LPCRCSGLNGEFPPLTYQGLAFFTVIGVGAGVLVFAGFALWSSRPIAIYRKVALVVLALSMLPDAWLPGNVPGATWPIAIVLMVTARRRLAADGVRLDESSA